MQYFILGSSLATILEIPSQADCLKALQVVVQEYDYFIASESKSKMVQYTHPYRKKNEEECQLTSHLMITHLYPSPLQVLE